MAPASDPSFRDCELSATSVRAENSKRRVGDTERRFARSRCTLRIVLQLCAAVLSESTESTAV
jgi:hypothetical protein